MKNFRTWVTDILACHSLLASRNLGAGDRENTIKLSAGLTVATPLIVAVIALIGITSNALSGDQIKVLAFVAAILIVFGVSTVTDRIYNRNAAAVRRRAEEIERDSTRGVMWVRRRLFKFYMGNVLLAVAIILLIKFVG